MAKPDFKAGDAVMVHIADVVRPGRVVSREAYANNGTGPLMPGYMRVAIPGMYGCPQVVMCERCEKL